MESFGYFSVHIVLIATYIAAVALGAIYFRTKAFSDLCVFVGFLIYCGELTLQLYFGPSATFDADDNLVRTEGLLPLTVALAAELTAAALIALGFTMRAYSLIKKT